MFPKSAGCLTPLTPGCDLALSIRAWRTIFGCSKAPGDEPKLSVSTPDHAAVPVTPAAVVGTRLPPPPPPPGGVVSPAATQELRDAANRVVPSMFGGFGGQDALPSSEQPEIREPEHRTRLVILGVFL